MNARRISSPWSISWLSGVQQTAAPTGNRFVASGLGPRSIRRCLAVVTLCRPTSDEPTRNPRPETSPTRWASAAWETHAMSNRPLLVIGLLVVAACSGSAKHAAAPTSTTIESSVSATTTTSRLPRATLELREVARTGAARVMAGRPSCTGVTLGRSPDAIGSAPTVTGRLVVLPDRNGKTCYELGPALVTGADVASTTVIYDSTTSRWGINLHLANKHFLTRIAQPLVNDAVAVVLNGVVQSAPTINPGITGYDVELVADTRPYSRSQAIAVAAAIMGELASAVRVSS
jgi:hypothetical protein